MTDDIELLRRYAEENSDAAFAELVGRRIDFVYAAALRQARGNASLAQDVTQAVFTDLARKAAELAHHKVIVGWLHTATRFAAAKTMRAESRRRMREQAAHAMNEPPPEPSAPVDWDRLRPVLDAVLGELKERERTAILLRFFEQKPFTEIGTVLSLTETAARSCVNRALEKLRTRLAQRGVESTAAALSLALATQTSVAAPAGFAASVTGAALASAGAVGSASAAAAFMGMTKLQMSLFGAIALAGTTGVVWQAKATAAARQELAELQRANTTAERLAADEARSQRAADEAANAARMADLNRLRNEATGLRGQLQTLSAHAAKSHSVASVAPFTGSFLEPSQVDVKAKPTFQPPPIFPPALSRNRIPGKVTVDFVVDPQGRVRNANVIESSQPEFAEAVLTAIRDWTFAPAQKDGQAVAMHVREPFVFTYNDQTQTTASDSGRPSSAAKKKFIPWF